MFTNLKSLSVKDNVIGTIKPLKSLSNLTYLAVSNNRLLSLDGIEGHKNLRYLLADGNPLMDHEPPAGTHLFGYWVGQADVVKKLFDRGQLAQYTNFKFSWRHGEKQCLAGWSFN